MAKKELPKELTPQQRAERCQQKIEKILEKDRCFLAVTPSYRLRDDGTWSLVTTVEVSPNRMG